MPIGAAISAQILTSYLDGSVVSLHLADPGATGASEADGGSYARQACEWSVDAGLGAARNAGPLVFRGVAGGTYVGWGAWTAEGDWLDGGLLAEPVVVGDDGIVEIAAGALRLSGPEHGGGGEQPGDLFSLPPERDGFWLPGLMAVGGIPEDDDPVRPAQVYLPPGDPYGGYSIDPALAGSGQSALAAINAAIQAAAAEASESSRRVVLLPPGEFAIANGPDSFINMNVNFVTLRGQGARGPNATRLLRLVRDADDSMIICIGHRWVGVSEYGDTVVMPDGMDHVPRGSYTLTVASATHPYTVGELVMVDQLEDPERVGSWFNPVAQPDPEGGSRRWFCRQNRPTAQVMEVTAVEPLDGGAVRLTFNTPIRHNLYETNLPQIARFTGGLGPSGAPQPTHRWCGLENVYVEGGSGGDGGGNIGMYAVSYCWVKDCESAWSIGASVGLRSTFRCEIRGTFCHSTTDPNPGGAGYGIGMNTGAADNLVEDCISWNFNKCMFMRSTGGGNVFGYCYMMDGRGGGYPTIPEVGLNAAHFGTPSYELIEGCESWNIAGDALWGNSIYLTFVRNNVTGLRRAVPPLDTVLVDSSQRRIVEVPEWQLWSTYLGNVLGFEDMPAGTYNGFIYEQTPPWNSGGFVPVWQVGRQHNAGLEGQDTQVVATTIRHGNFDWLREQQDSHEGDTRAVPASLYHTSKPAFFGANPWPWVDPVTGQVHTLPAKARFDAYCEQSADGSPYEDRSGF